jgi:hypothetical protein
MEMASEISELVGILRSVFQMVFDELKSKNITEKSLDEEVLRVLRNYVIAKKHLKLNFSEPKDEIYKVEKGRTPYDVLCYGNIVRKDFRILINNKFGNLYSKSLNDITTYNNLIRLYLDIRQQKLKGKVIIDGDKVYKRVLGEEIISYGVFVFDARKRGFNFFLLEEIDDDFYVNPRNTMFQARYSPQISKTPLDYYSFMTKLIDATVDSLKKSKASIEAEVLILQTIKQQIMSIKGKNE